MGYGVQNHFEPSSLIYLTATGRRYSLYVLKLSYTAVENYILNT